MKYCFVFFLLFFSVTGIAQTEHLEEFYPANKLYKKLKVKTVTDSFMIVPEHSRIKIYDTAGREISDRKLTAGINPDIWYKNGDTLTRLNYYGEPGHAPLFSLEQFIYNSKGEIQRHALSYHDYSGGKEIYASLNVFYYNSTRLYCRLEYRNHNYPKEVEMNMQIKESELELSSAIYYTYKKTTKGITIIAKETVGKKDWRRTDTLVYNKANRLVKQSSFSKQGTTGEMVFNNFNQVTEKHFDGNIIRIKMFYTDCIVVTADGLCLSPQYTETDKREIWLNKYGLPEAEYSYYSHNGERYLVSKYYYTFYE